MSAVVGTVVKFWPDRAYGYLKPDGAHGDYYFHADDMAAGRPYLGARASFDVGRDKKDPRRIRAVNVTLL
jgi:cold shock CspA family protein